MLWLLLLLLIAAIADLEQIQAAMAEWEAATCLDFRPATSEDENYILLQGGQGLVLS